MEIACRDLGVSSDCWGVTSLTLYENCCDWFRDLLTKLRAPRDARDATSADIFQEYHIEIEWEQRHLDEVNSDVGCLMPVMLSPVGHGLYGSKPTHL